MHNNNKNLFLALFLSMAVMIGWTWLYEKPRMEKKEAQKQELQQQLSGKQSDNKQSDSSDTTQNNSSSDKKEKVINSKERSIALRESSSLRVLVENDNVSGSILLKGARFDDLVMTNYFNHAASTKLSAREKAKDRVALLSPADSKERYFVDFGFVSSVKNIDLPGTNTVWKSSSSKLTPDNPITLSWRNPQAVEFFIDVAIDRNYLFTVTQRVVNHSSTPIAISSYGRVDRVLQLIQKSNYILHEGLIGAFDGTLSQKTYTEMSEEKEFTRTNGGILGSWLGITDKYWLTSIMPDRNLNYSAGFKYELNNQTNLFAADFVSKEEIVESTKEAKFSHHLFAGAKQVNLLDSYGKELDLKLFDRAVDFGWFYFLTKPFFLLIQFLYKILGNFGLAILAMTVLIKVAMFPMANKSFVAIARIKQLQPRIEAIRNNFQSDRLAMNKAIMDLYKKEKVNPASGCLPILIQIPIFFALYKVLFVTLDMRHAPFYGWIRDLSAPDPTSIFNLFGLLPFEVSSAFHIGAWPILMGITMMVQQKLNPSSGDKTQMQVMKWMPYILTFVLASFPAGLLIYWTWSNILSIVQQFIITKRIEKHGIAVKHSPKTIKSKK